MFETVVFSAGGTLGASYIGAFRALELRHAVSKVRHYHGTSAGSVVALMAACGLTSAEMIGVMHTMCAARPDFCAFDPTRFGVASVRDVLKPGLDAFLAPNATFACLAKRSGVTLTVHAYNVSRGRLEDFGISTTPDADVRACVEASCCIPFVFAPVSIGGDMYVDGAVAQRSPIHAVSDRRRSVVFDVCRDHRPPSTLFEFISVLTSAASRHVGPYEGLIVRISAAADSPDVIDLPLEPDRLQVLVDAGFETADACIQGHAKVIAYGVQDGEGDEERDARD